MKTVKSYMGRLMSADSLPENLKKEAIPCPSMVVKQGNLICFRCGSKILKEWSLPNGDNYCRACLIFGRNTSSRSLYTVAGSDFPKINSLLWSGQLTPYQKEISDGLLENYKAKKPTLVHAVTGAGKTEMIYELVAKVLDDGGVVALASPRIDVCIELYRRLLHDFSCPISLMHGGSDLEIESPLVIATTHQLLKFHNFFDLVIVDEVDAFPYVDNDMLYYGVSSCRKKDGFTVFLTATSTDALDKKVRRGELTRLELSRRFHSNPLVVPKMIWLGHLEKKLKKQKLPLKFFGYVKRQLETHYPLLLFYPTISEGKILTEILQEYFPQLSIGFVSSQTENRKEIVEDFRAGRIRILVSTTILERGVTFPCVDVFILSSNHFLYTKSALIQIAGRAGRSMERPTGDVFFFHDGKTKSMQKAILEIKKMNKKGGFI